MVRLTRKEAPMWLVRATCRAFPGLVLSWKCEEKLVHYYRAVSLNQLSQGLCGGQDVNSHGSGSYSAGGLLDCDSRPQAGSLAWL